jgi:hypothetical protein
MNITQLFLVKLHPENKSKNYELIKLPLLSQEVSSLFDILKLKHAGHKDKAHSCEDI